VDILGKLREATEDYEARKRQADDALLARNALIVKAALETTESYEEIGAAAGISLSGVWKVAEAAGVSRQRVQRRLLGDGV